MAADDWVQRSARPRNTPAGVVGLFGLFAGLCAIFALVGTVVDWREEAAQARWPVVSALIEQSYVDSHRPKPHSAILWQLRYRVRYEAAAAGPLDAGTFSPRGRIAVGAIVAALGLLMIGLNVHAALQATHPLTSEDFIGSLAAMIFVFGGALLALPPDRAGWQMLTGALLVTTFALTLDWVAFGPGTRRFGGGISFGIGIGFHVSEFMGRTVFGIGAVVLDILAAVMWVRLIRGGDPRGGPPSTAGP
jgi:hypothetical protein